MKAENEQTERRKTKRIPGLYSGQYAYQEEPGGFLISRGPSVEEIGKMANKQVEETGESWGPLLGAADY